MEIQSINVKEKSLGIEPEITVKLARKIFILYEVLISYQGRSYEERKKNMYPYFLVFSIFLIK